MASLCRHDLPAATLPFHPLHPEFDYCVPEPSHASRKTDPGCMRGCWSCCTTGGHTIRLASVHRRSRNVFERHHCACNPLEWTCLVLAELPPLDYAPEYVFMLFQNELCHVHEQNDLAPRQLFPGLLCPHSGTYSTKRAPRHTFTPRHRRLSFLQAINNDVPGSVGSFYCAVNTMMRYPGLCRDNCV